MTAGSAREAPKDRCSPAANRGASKTVCDCKRVPEPTDILADVDARAQSLQGYLVVQVTIDNEGHRRTYPFRSAAAAQRCIERARDRGRTAHVSLVQMLPIGVVVGLGGGRGE